MCIRDSYTTAINYMAGNPSNTYEVIVEEQGKTAALVFGSWQNWLVAFITLGIVVALNHYGKGLFKLASILIGLVCGYVVALCFGMVDFSALSSAGWFQIPKPFEFGMRFEISAIIPLAILFLVNSIPVSYTHLCGHIHHSCTLQSWRVRPLPVYYSDEFALYPSA